MKSIPLSWSGPEKSRTFPALITESGRPQAAAVYLSLQDALSQTYLNHTQKVSSHTRGEKLYVSASV